MSTIGLHLKNEENLPLEDCLDQYHIKLILVTSSLVKDETLNKFSEWNGFINNPSINNWTRMEIDGTEDYFLIKDGAL